MVTNLSGAVIRAYPKSRPIPFHRQALPKNLNPPERESVFTDIYYFASI
ncbi:MAG: hypothetical protein ABRQ37_03540 [Candidatus Eremiobacterota bacterium]